MAPSLPSELLFQIFESLSDNHPVEPHEPPNVWRCAQVCARWRSILCRHMPWLWSEIQVDVDNANVGARNVLDHCLNRARGRPLSITLKRSVRLALCDGDTTGSKFKDYLQQLTPHCTRWHSFSCHGLFAHELEQFSSVKGRLPILRHLHLYIHDDFLHDYPSDIDAFSIAPNLQSARILGTHLTRPPLVLPWTQLTSYQANQSHCHLVDVLRSAPDMESCTISSRPSIHDPYNGPSIHHEKLLALSVYGTHVLSHLSLPSLQKLTITLNSPLELAALTSFLKGPNNTKSPLRELKLTGHFRFSNLGHNLSDLLKDLFMTTPSLTSLDFGLLLPQASNMLYSLLNVGRSNDGIVPELHSLTVHPSLLQDHCETMLLAMIASRYRASCCAFKVKLGDRVMREHTSIVKLEELGKNALDRHRAHPRP